MRTGNEREKTRVRPVRRDDLGDAAGVAAVLESVIAEGGLTVLTGRWTPEAELAFLGGLGPRIELFVAEAEGEILGFQIIEPFVGFDSAMDHVATIGTYIHSESRGQGIGRLLADEVLAFARAQEYEKVVIYVLSSNTDARAYYQHLGFVERGLLERQAKIDGDYHDEVVMELLLDRLRAR